MANTFPRPEEKRISASTLPEGVGFQFLVSAVGLFLSLATAYHLMKRNGR